jgi:hypothetical protein
MNKIKCSIQENIISEYRKIYGLDDGIEESLVESESNNPVSDVAFFYELIIKKEKTFLLNFLVFLAKLKLISFPLGYVKGDFRLLKTNIEPLGKKSAMIKINITSRFTVLYLKCYFASISCVDISDVKIYKKVIRDSECL